MSYCAIIAFKDGKPSEGVEFKNAWGGAARIWNSMFNQYLKNPLIEHDNWMLSSDKLWPLATRFDVPELERAVLAATYDRAIVRRDDFVRYAADLRAFMAKYPIEGICHLASWADFIRACEAEAIGFHGTSISSNPWFVHDKESEEFAPYDLRTGTDHFDVYEYIQKDEKGA